jgi:sugar-specific transcriptional regulator TrmB
VLPDRIKEDIDFELGEIDLLIQLYEKELFDMEKSLNLVELTALAGVLHSFYNGIENTLLIIAKNIDKNIPSDFDWHKSLLEQMAKENNHRKAVLTIDTKNELLKYLGFRHFFRHSYSFHLKWERMEELVKPIRRVWEKFKAEISAFDIKISS